MERRVGPFEEHRGDPPSSGGIGSTVPRTGTSSGASRHSSRRRTKEGRAVDTQNRSGGNHFDVRRPGDAMRKGRIRYALRSRSGKVGGRQKGRKRVMVILKVKGKDTMNGKQTEMLINFIL